MPLPTLGPEEVVATLKKSSLPTIVVEGRSDSYIYRYLERKTGASVMPVGGRNTLLQVLKERLSFVALPCAFVADRDMWVISGVPMEALSDSLVLTDGYSIENDVYRDAQLERMLNDQQLAIFEAERREICRWFSFAATKWEAGAAPKLDYHPKRIVGANRLLDPTFISDCGFDGECPQKFPVLLGDPAKYLRGKTLVDLLIKVLAENGGGNHNSSTILQIGSLNPGKLLTSLSDDVAAILGR